MEDFFVQIKSLRVNDKQRHRLNSLLNDDVRLLKLNKNSFEIVGLSGVYTVTLIENTLSCTCLDFLTHAKKYGVVCKHICFVVCRFGKIFDGKFFDTKKLNDVQVAKLTGGTPARIIGGYVDDDTECPICYVPLRNFLVVTCPACKNDVHVKCITVWLNTHDTCIYCRDTQIKNMM